MLRGLGGSLLWIFTTFHSSLRLNIYDLQLVSMVWFLYVKWDTFKNKTYLKKSLLSYSLYFSEGNRPLTR